METQQSVTLYSNGDVLNGSTFAVAGDFLPANIRIPEGESWRSMADKLRETINDADGVFVNMESPVFMRGHKPTAQMGDGKKLSVPIDSIAYLQQLNTVAVGIANNHIYDFGDAGLSGTRAAFEQAGIACIGAGRWNTKPPEIYLWTPRADLSIGFWAAAVACRELSTSRRQGVEPANIRRGILAQQQLREAGAKTLVALLHAGAEGTSYPDPEDVQLIDSLAMSGFDVVGACHSHRISGGRTITRADGTTAVCFYGLGSLVSTEMYSQLETEGIVAFISLADDGRMIRAEARPVQLSIGGWGETPDANNCMRILTRFREISRVLSDETYKISYYRDRSHSLLGAQWRDLSVGFRGSGIKAVVNKIMRIRSRHIKLIIHRFVSAS